MLAGEGIGPEGGALGRRALELDTQPCSPTATVRAQARPSREPTAVVAEETEDEGEMNSLDGVSQSSWWVLFQPSR